MDRLNKFLKPSLAKKGLLGTAESAQICFYATKWTLTPFSPISCAKGVLKVSVLSSSASSELQMQEENLISFINTKIGREIVKSIRIINLS
jgi:predicted nucleic acid-binding Zn ribbon protein